MHAWHWTDGWKLRDGTPLLEGKTYVHQGEVSLCKSGYRGSRNLLDSLKWATGTVLSRVSMVGQLQTDLDGEKFVGREREVLSTREVSEELHQFALNCARRALRLIDEPRQESLWALRTKKLWIEKKADEEDVKEAQERADFGAGLSGLRISYATSDFGPQDVISACAHQAVIAALESDPLQAAHEAAQLERKAVWQKEVWDGQSWDKQHADNAAWLVRFNQNVELAGLVGEVKKAAA